MKKKDKGFPYWLLCSLLILSLGLGGCTRSNSDTASYASKSMGGGSAVNSIAMSGIRSQSSMDMAEESAYYMEDTDYDESTGSSPGPSLAASKEVANEEAGQKEGETPPPLEEKLVYSGNVTIETMSFSETLENLKKTIRELGGFIEYESQNDSSYGWYLETYQKSSSLSASLQVRIPSRNFYSFLDGLQSPTSKVTSRSVFVENISQTYSETATQIESLEIQQARLLEMMKDASRVSDMLEIEARLSDVQNSLKNYKNRLSMMDTNVAYSTLNISLNEVGIYSQPEATTYGEKLLEAFQDAVETFQKNLSSFSIWFVRNFFNILVTILCIYLAVRFLQFLFRRRNRKPDRRNHSRGFKRGRRNQESGPVQMPEPFQEKSPEEESQGERKET